MLQVNKRFENMQAFRSRPAWISTMLLFLTFLLDALVEHLLTRTSHATSAKHMRHFVSTWLVWFVV